MSIIEKVSGKKKRQWHERAITDFWRKNEAAIVSGGLVLIFLAVISAQIFLLKHTFVWENREVFSMLSWDRVLFSAITYLTIGEVLYDIYFYKALSFFFHTILHDHHGYIAAKRTVWWGLMLFMYFYVQPIVIKCLNVVITILYNIFAFLAYSLPALAIVLLFFAVYLLIKKMRPAH